VTYSSYPVGPVPQSPLIVPRSDHFDVLQQSASNKKKISPNKINMPTAPYRPESVNPPSTHGYSHITHDVSATARHLFVCPVGVGGVGVGVGGGRVLCVDVCYASHAFANTTPPTHTHSHSRTPFSCPALLSLADGRRSGWRRGLQQRHVRGVWSIAITLVAARR
jgi:hypothetical protein